MTSLALAIEQAQAANLRKLAAEVPIPQQELDSEAVMHLRHFAEWAKSRGVKYLPCAPATLAAFIRSESANGVPPERILTALEAIERAHDSAGLANSVATSVVRFELGRLNVDLGPKHGLTLGPRNWSKAERVIFISLPEKAQEIIARHLDLDSRAVKRAQNEAADLRKQLTAIQTKEINSHVTPDQTRT